MSYGYDDQLIDAYAVRRQRLETALVFGDQRLRRRFNDRTRTFVLAAFLAVIACAACVAVSFVSNLLANDTTLRPPSTQSAPHTDDDAAPGAVQDPTPRATPSPARGDIVGQAR